VLFPLLLVYPSFHCQPIIIFAITQKFSFVLFELSYFDANIQCPGPLNPVAFSVQRLLLRACVYFLRACDLFLESRSLLFSPRCPKTKICSFSFYSQSASRAAISRSIFFLFALTYSRCCLCFIYLYLPIRVSIALSSFF